MPDIWRAMPDIYRLLRRDTLCKISTLIKLKSGRQDAYLLHLKGTPWDENFQFFKFNFYRAIYSPDLKRGDLLYTSESAICRQQILTYEEGLCTERINVQFYGGIHSEKRHQHVAQCCGTFNGPLGIQKVCLGFRWIHRNVNKKYFF